MERIVGTISGTGALLFTASKFPVIADVLAVSVVTGAVAIVVTAFILKCHERRQCVHR